MRIYTNKEILHNHNIITDFNEDESGKISEYHTHEFVEIKYILDGTATEWINDNEYNVSKGHFLFVNCGQSHRFIANEKLSYVNIMIKQSFVSKIFDSIDNVKEIFALSLYDDFFSKKEFKIQCVIFDGEERDEVEYILNKMKYEHKCRDSLHEQIVQGYLTVLFGMFFRNVIRSMSNNESAVDDIASEIFEYIEEKCFESISLSELATKSFYNPAYFGRLLKKHYGISFSSYLKQKRISKACELLLDDKLSVTDVYQYVGYQERLLFLRHFKEVMNMTPTEYRNMNGIK